MRILFVAYPYLTRISQANKVSVATGQHNHIVCVQKMGKRSQPEKLAECEDRA